jgi:hypothetical protein
MKLEGGGYKLEPRTGAAGTLELKSEGRLLVSE